MKSQSYLLVINHYTNICIALAVLFLGGCVTEPIATRDVEITRGPDGRFGVVIGVFRHDYGGVVIERTLSGSSAERAGLGTARNHRPRDIIIIEANGHRIRSQGQLLEILRSNDRVVLTVIE